MFIAIYALLLSLTAEAVLGVRLEQKDLSLTKEEGKTVHITCKVSSLSTTYVHWYQQKDGEVLKRILYVKRDSPPVPDDPVEGKKFDVRIQSDNYDLKIAKLDTSHSAVYYCAAWESGTREKVFGAGTRLYVTDAKKEKPKVSVFPVSRDQGKGKRVLLCQARDMFPNIVKFRWENSNAQPVQASQDGYDLLEQTDDQEKRITSMLIVDESIIKAPYKYKCFVKHETDERTEQSFFIPTDQPAVAPKCPQGGQDDPQDGDPISGVSEHSRSLYLFSMTYVMLLVKNMLYFCIIFFLLYKRNSANKGMLKGKAR